MSSHWLQPGEVRSGLVLAALVLLVFPLVPNQSMLQGLLNPQVVLRLVIVLLVIQSLAHVARRLLFRRLREVGNFHLRHGVGRIFVAIAQHAQLGQRMLTAHQQC